MAEFTRNLVMTLNNLSWLANLFGLIGTLTSIATFVTLLRYKHKVGIEFERNAFSSKCGRILRELDGFSSSLSDDIYSKKLLEEIDSCLVDLKCAYTFFNSKLKRKIKNTSIMINNCCLVEVTAGKDAHRHDLARSLREINALIRKVR